VPIAVRKLIFLFVALLVFGGARPARSGEPIRLALVAQSAELPAAADMLTANLSAVPDLQLLERAEIDKIYREQALSAGNRDLLRLGQILGADGLLLLEIVKEGGDSFLAVRLVAVKPGVVLTGERFHWPLASAVDWARGVSDHLRPLIPKLNVSRTDAVPISILNLRSSVQTGAGLELERQLTLLMAERLSREPRLFVVERRAMQLLTRENEWKGLDDSSFWTGSYLLEGTIDPEGYSAEKMTISARLKPPDGGAVVPITINCARTNLADAVNQLAERTLAGLNIKGADSAWNASAEAVQYLAEAKWAYRWGLYAQARDASESAWALGEPTRELAVLRIRSYAESVWRIEEHTGNVMFPVVPDSAAFGPLVRAAQLYDQGAHSEFPGGAPLDNEWFMMGFRLLRQMAAILEGYYYSAELREGHETELGELRQIARGLDEELNARIPLDLVSNGLTLPNWVWVPTELGKSEIHYPKELLAKFYDTQFGQAGVWCDHPADAVPVFRRAIERGFYPGDSPRFAAWTWNERRQIPAILERFIHDLAASANPGVRLEGLYLTMARADSSGPEDGLQPGEQELIDSIWNQRDWALSSAGHVSILKRAADILADSFTARTTSRRAKEAMEELANRLRREYLRNTNSPDEDVFVSLFPSTGARIFPQAIAEELIPLMESLAERVTWKNRIVGIANIYRGTYGLKIEHPLPGIPTFTLARGDPLPVPFIKWNLKLIHPFGNFQPKPRGVIVRGGKVWSRVCYMDGDYESPFNSLISYVSVDPRTGESDEIRYPAERGISDPCFEVTDDSLYVGARNQIDRYWFRERRWESIPVPVEKAAQIVAVNGLLYIANGEGLIELEPDSGKSRILASTRREPRVSEMDSAWGPELRLFSRKDGKLGVMLANLVFAFTSANGGSWEHSAQVPPTDGRFYRSSFVSPEGAFLLLDGIYRPIFLAAFWNGDPKPGLLLRERTPRDHPAPDIEGLFGSPDWDWPAPYELDFPCFTTHGRGLWLLYPRKRSMINSFVSAPIVEFPDDRNSTLMIFEPGTKEALCVPIRFEKEGQAFDPFEHLWGAPIRIMITTNPVWEETPDGAVLICPMLAGNWFISPDVLESRLKPLRAAAKARVGIPGVTNSIVELKDRAAGQPAAVTNSTGGVRK